MGHESSKENVLTRYDFREVLGSGNYAQVRRAIRKKDKKEFAIKIVSKAKLDAKELKFVQDEAFILRKCNHQNVVKLFDIYENESKIYLVLELLKGGTMFDMVANNGAVTEKRAAEITKQMASSLFYMHYIGVVHRDLKPENLMFDTTADDALVKITDFGLAKYISQTAIMQTCCGSPNYVAPEVLFGEGSYTEAVDMWSLGCTVYILLSGCRPFENSQPRKLFEQIKHGKYRFHPKYWKHVSPEAKDLVSKLLCVDPNKRLSAAEVLLHPWISGNVRRKKEVPMSPTSRNMPLRVRILETKKKLKRGIVIMNAFHRFIHFADWVKAQKAAKAKKESELPPQIQALMALRRERTESLAQRNVMPKAPNLRELRLRKINEIFNKESEFDDVEIAKAHLEMQYEKQDDDNPESNPLLERLRQLRSERDSMSQRRSSASKPKSLRELRREKLEKRNSIDNLEKGRSRGVTKPHEYQPPK